jgi:hypothetical protein
MNARLDAKTKGMAIFKGDIDVAIAIEAAIGRKVDVVAVFDVSSVKKMIKVTIRNTIIQGLRLTAKINASPSHWPSPELFIAFAKDRPPPNKIRRPHGNFFVSSQISKSVFLFCDGIMKRLIAAIIAMPASVNPTKILYSFK